MSAPAPNKARKANWSEREVAVLVDECTRNYDLIVGKQSNDVREKDKNEFWRETSER